MTTILPGERFTISPHDDGTKVLVAEASDFQLGRGGPMPRQLYVKSHRTGQTVCFNYCGVDYNGDEIAGWRYHPDVVDATCIPGAHRARLLIIND